MKLVGALILASIASVESSQLKLSRRWQRCVVDSGFVTGGHWQPSISIPLAGEFCDKEHEPMRLGIPRHNTSDDDHWWTWAPKDPACDLVPLSAGAFCDSAESLGVSRILLVGDSLMRNWHESLVRLLRAGVRGCRKRKGGGGTITHPEVQVSMQYIPTMVGQAPAAVARLIASFKPDLLVVNWGAHYGRHFDRGSVVSEYRKDSSQMAVAVHNAMEALGLRSSGRATPLVLFRTTLHGHRGCQHFDGPTQNNEEAPPTPPPYVHPLQTPGVKDYAEVDSDDKWDLFDQYNKIASEIWMGQFSGSRVALQIMDAAEMARDRGDLHQYRPPSTGVEKDAADQRHHRRDCLHFLHRVCPRGLFEMDAWVLTLLFNFLHARAASSFLGLLNTSGAHSRHIAPQ